MPEVAPHTSYDEVPYPELCYTQSHPDRLATCGLLLGMSPAPVESCRVLELGCAGGGNLLPMATALPDSTFVGLDNSPRQIDMANQAVADLGLRNAAFVAMDIRHVTPALGTFDYIIAHGIYSWVPPDVRDRLLAVCAANLAPQGIAYVSYNTLPGWHGFLALREMMLYHARGEVDSHGRAGKARELVTFLGAAVSDETNRAYGSFMDSYRELLRSQEQDGRTQSDSVILHDELSEYNEPVYLHQFAAHAERHGLQFLIEADLPMSMPQNLSPDVFQALQRMSASIVETEQYMDFIRNRAFRRTLLCHAGVPLDRTLHTTHLRGMAIATRATRVPAPESPGVARYASPDGAVFQTDDPFSTAALDYLAEVAPAAVPFPDLAQVAARAVGQPVPVAADTRALGASLLKAYTYSVSLVELHAWRPPFVSGVSARPIAFPYARYQARHNDRVANLRHERVVLDPLSRYLLPHLDGTLTVDDLGGLLDDLVARGSIKINDPDVDPTDVDRVRERTRAGLSPTLAWLARAGLLIG